MKVSQIADQIRATVLSGADMDDDIQAACGSDMMSDVLAYANGKGMLITGLVNPQVVRTAHMLDMHCIVFARGKTPTAEMVSLAADNGIAVMVTEMGMFEACGLLYGAGLGY